ncbi:MAG: hypothetical protein K6T59_09525, partial [Bryobacteraceae bacterium]|nr:hypothetical protein [Bryobacteraceae bacterium]
TFTDESLRNRLTRETGTAVVSPPAFHTFTDLDEHVRQQIQKIRAHPWIPHSIPVRGFVYDVRDGRLREVVP